MEALIEKSLEEAGGGCMPRSAGRVSLDKVLPFRSRQEGIYK